MIRSRRWTGFSLTECRSKFPVAADTDATIMKNYDAVQNARAEYAPARLLCDLAGRKDPLHLYGRRSNASRGIHHGRRCANSLPRQKAAELATLTDDFSALMRYRMGGFVSSAAQTDGLFDPGGEGLQIFAEKNSCVALFVSLPVFVEHLVHAPDIGFRLLQRRHVQEHQRLAQMMVGARKTADGARRCADDSGRFSRSRRFCHRDAIPTVDGVF